MISMKFEVQELKTQNACRAGPPFLVSDEDVKNLFGKFHN